MRSQATTYECLQSSNEERFPYLAGVLVGLICTAIQIKVDLDSLKAFEDYSTQFEFHYDQAVTEPFDTKPVTKEFDN
jgi:hypothetical protein